MSVLTVTFWGQSAVRLERDGHRIAIDPGDLSDARVLEAADTVLVTHEHQDHVDVPLLAAHLAARPSAQAWGTRVVLERLAAEGVASDQLHLAMPGSTFDAAGFSISVIGGEHAVIHPAFPPVDNVGYIVDGAVLHPGDSFAEPPSDAAVKLLLLPVWGPWLKFSETADYFQTVAPEVVTPIHDEMVTAAGREFTDFLMSQVGEGAEYRRLAPGGTDQLSVDV